MRRSIAALWLVAVALLPACSRNKAPDSLFDAAGYHARGDKVYYLSAFPGKASEIAGADATSFKAFDTTYAKDKSNAYFDGHPIPAADATTFAVLDRGGFAKDRNHVYQLDRPISDDPAHFELLEQRPLPVHEGQSNGPCQRKTDRRRRSGDIPCVAGRPCAGRAADLLFHQPGRRCGCGVVPCARRTVCR